MGGDLPAPSFTPGTGGRPPQPPSWTNHISLDRKIQLILLVRETYVYAGVCCFAGVGGGGLDLTAPARRNRDRHTGTETASQPASETATDGGNM